MFRVPKMWLCQYCNSKSLDAHIKALEDYSLVISPTISNREARNYLRIASPDVAKRILKGYPDAGYGITNSKRYQLRSVRVSRV